MWSFCLWRQPSYRGSAGGPATVTGLLCEVCLTEELQRATATCWQPPHTTDWNLDLTVPTPPPSPQCSLFPVPSCLTIPFFFSSLLSWAVPLIESTESIASLFPCMSFSQSYPPLANEVRVEIIDHFYALNTFFFFYLLKKKKDIMTKIKFQHHWWGVLESIYVMIRTQIETHKAQTGWVILMDCIVIWWNNLFFSQNSQGSEHSYLALVT